MIYLYNVYWQLYLSGRVKYLQQSRAKDMKFILLKADFYLSHDDNKHSACQDIDNYTSQNYLGCIRSLT